MTIQVTKKLLSSSLDGKHYSSKEQTQLWIVIHNTGGGTANSAYSWFNNPSNQYQTSAHYCVDDTVVIQCLEDNWKGHHTTGSGQKYNDKLTPSGADGVSNSNSIGIEVADWGGSYTSEQFNKALENAIGLTKMLMEKHNIDVNHVVRHGDTQDKDCPHYINSKENKWQYFKEQLQSETGGTIIENPNPSSTSGSGSNDSSEYSSTTGGGFVNTNPYWHDYWNDSYDILPNVDHRPNIANMDEVKGACLIFLPPYNACNSTDMEAHFKKLNWDKKYHYIINPVKYSDNSPTITEKEEESTSASPTPEEDNSITIKGGFDKKTDRLLQCYSLMDNNKVTYISRSLFKSKPEKHNIMIACLVPPYEELTKLGYGYNVVEQNIINSTAQILWVNGLKTEQLWREFDLNRAPSPLLYLERTRWLKLLTEIDKQLTWMNQSYGEVKANYSPYIATVEEITGIDIGVPGGYIGGGGGGVTSDAPGSSIGGGNWEQGEVGGDLLLFVKQMEGFAPSSYTPPEGGGNKAIGYGCTKFPGQANAAYTAMVNVSPISEEIAAKYLADEINKNYAAPILDCCKNTLKITQQCQFDALVSVSYNAGPGSVKSGKLHDVIKADPTNESAIRSVWESYKCTGGGVYLSGLAKRRKAECDMFFGKGVSKTGISIVGTNGKPTGQTVTENDGKGWLPTVNSSDDNGTEAQAVSYMMTLNTPAFTAANAYTVQPRTGANKLAWPCPGHNMGSSSTAKFGMRLHPIKKVMKMHNGIDIPAPSGTPIYTPLGGTVTTNAYQAGGAGNYIKIDHGNGLTTVYMHMVEKSPCAKGSTVTAGQQIGKVGTTGGSTGNHLHFEVHENGTPVDPLGYTSYGVEKGTLDGSEIIQSGGNNGNQGDSGSGNTNQGWTGSDAGVVIDASELVNSTAGNIVNPGPAGAFEGSLNSMGGLTHEDWGGKMTYELDSASNPSAVKPKINNIISNKDYKDFCDAYFTGYETNEAGEIITTYDFRNYWNLVDIYVSEHEPYDKGLVDAVYAKVEPNDRLASLTKNFTTLNENMFHFNVVESGPGTAHHCVKAADELNVISVPLDLTVEPIYPDLVIPPEYDTRAYDEISPNTIPLQLLDKGLSSDDLHLKQYEFDYSILKEVRKETAGTAGPINMLDPYPFDKKIEELEKHYPKVMIDEIESQIYSDNHPGSPIAQPIAKNFAMIQDAMMSQSKKVEQRLVKLENILSTIIRNQARLGARVNINCVYYGGQSTYAGKYKCIRCLHDDRINDETVTIDQCLNCTRYEPILGQVYEILDESGMNGSIILDDMQMSYSNLADFKKINSITERSPKYDFVAANGEEIGFKPKYTQAEIWKKGYQERYLENNPEVKDINTVNETDYLFRMDWNETFLNAQEPDIKQYPAEGIVARYRNSNSDMDYDEYIKSLDPDKDRDAIVDAERAKLVSRGEWVDTREEADSVQVNKYSSENFYFEGFAEMNGVTEGSGAVPGDTPAGSGGGGTSSNPSTGGSALRDKIVEMAKLIVADHDAGNAKYCQSPRTVDYKKPQTSGGKVCYDCTSFVSCCYLHAGLNSMYSKSCSGGTLVAEIVNNGGDMWLLDDAGLQKAKPGDVLLKATSKVTQAKMGTKIATSHAMIYIGDGKISHAASTKTGIKTETLKDSFRWKDGCHFFVRPKDLKDADTKEANTTTATNPSSSGGSGVTEATGSVDGKQYVARIPGAVVTGYYGDGGSASGLGLKNNATCAAHNLPYGTTVYIPSLAGVIGNGVFTVTDTGGPFFDFDIYSSAYSSIGKKTRDAYILTWGTGATSASYTWGLNFYSDSQWKNLVGAWHTYKDMGGKLITFTKYKSDDANVKTNKRYNS